MPVNEHGQLKLSSIISTRNKTGQFVTNKFLFSKILMHTNRLVSGGFKWQMMSFNWKIDN